MPPYICIVKNDSPLDKATFQFLLHFSPSEKQQRIFRHRVKQNSDNMTIGGALARYMLWKNFHVPSNAQIAYGEFGKPYLLDYPGVHFNISHSGQFVACAVSDNSIGVDIQVVVPYQRDVAKRVCSPEELMQIESSPDPSVEFTKCWTQKEAYAKMKGTGLFNGLEMVDAFQNKVQTFEYLNVFVSIQEE